MLPHDLPPWRIVYNYFRQWHQDGTWQLRHDLFRGDVRVATGKPWQSRASIIEGRSVKTPDKEGSTAMIRMNTLTAASAISSSICEACCWPEESRVPMCKTEMTRCPCCPASATSSLARAALGPIKPLPETLWSGCGGCVSGGTSASPWFKTPRGPRAACCYRSAGSWSAPLAGLAATAACPKMMHAYWTRTSEAMNRVAMLHLMVRRLARMTRF
jgi:hypothetical protein